MRPTAVQFPRVIVVSGLGIVQILAFGTTYYLPAVLAGPIVADTGWPISLVIGGFSLGLLTAGLVSPFVGREIARRGGRAVLSSSSVLIGLGLALMGAAPSLPVFLVSWVVVGLGMGGGLYDATFSTLGRLYGREARGAIAVVTLWGGFASTVCWPLSTFLLDAVGWRETCFVYAALHVCLAMPFQLVLLSGASRAEPQAPDEATETATASVDLRDHVSTILLISAVVTVSGSIASMVSVHLLALLHAQGVGPETAVGIGALIGPAQVLARLAEMAIGRRTHPIWSMLASVSLIALGMVVLLAGPTVAAVALVLYGAGNGAISIAKGTLPLTLFGPFHYAMVMGRIARPALIAQALAPSLAAALIGAAGAGSLLPILAILGAIDVGLALALKARIGRAPRP
ncbi:MAG: MFS transporter [Microvirga sp.]